jgi:hypothetical protein
MAKGMADDFVGEDALVPGMSQGEDCGLATCCFI